MGYCYITIVQWGYLSELNSSQTLLYVFKRLPIRLQRKFCDEADINSIGYAATFSQLVICWGRCRSCSFNVRCDLNFAWRSIWLTRHSMFFCFCWTCRNLLAASLIYLITPIRLQSELLHLLLYMRSWLLDVFQLIHLIDFYIAHLFFVAVVIQRTIFLMRSVLRCSASAFVCAPVKLWILGSRWTSAWSSIHYCCRVTSASAVCTCSRYYCTCSR